MNARRISMVLDEEWLIAIKKFTEDVYPGEICFIESMSEPFEMEDASL